MTEMGYQNLIEEIKKIQVKPPQDLTTQELQCWMLGYGECYSDVIALIDSYIDHSR